MSLARIIALSAGTVVMFLVMLLCRKWRKYPIWKLAIINVLLTCSGTLGAYILYYIENTKWGGISFYGSILLIPFFFVPVALIMRIKYDELLDLCAPAVCAMLALNKVNCIRTGCCAGMVLHTHYDGTVDRFPSQIVELIVAVLIMIVLTVILAKGKLRGILYPSFLLIYGVTRFFLNLLRETTPFIWILPAGNFWSLVAIAIGVLWIVFAKKKSKAKNA